MLLGHRTEFPQEDQLKNFDLPTSENLKVEVDAIKDIKLEAVDDYDDLNQQGTVCVIDKSVYHLIGVSQNRQIISI